MNPGTATHLAASSHSKHIQGLIKALTSQSMIKAAGGVENPGVPTGASPLLRTPGPCSITFDLEAIHGPAPRTLS